MRVYSFVHMYQCFVKKDRSGDTVSLLVSHCLYVPHRDIWQTFNKKCRCDDDGRVKS